MGVMALVAPPCLSLGLVVMMCAPLGRPTALAVPVSTRITYAQTLKEGYGGAVGYGTAITRAQLRVFGPRNPASVACLGSECVGLATVDGFQYPALSRDHGSTWRNAGHWFAGAWADGAAFATRIEALSPSVFVAWPQLTGVYLTTDAGRVWYSVAAPGAPTAVTLGAGAVTLSVRASGGARRSYRSTDGGRLWTRAP